jgi:methionyl-tRNA formyltransferase
VARARTLFFGSGAFAAAVLEAVAAAPELDLVGVVTVPPRPAGRRGILSPTPVGLRAASLDVSLLVPERLRAAAAAALGALRPEVGILADYGRILPAAVLEIPAHGILNLHPSLLPRHRGATPIPAAILAGDAETGVSLFRMDAGMDTGPLVAVERTALAGDEDAPGLEARLGALAAALLGRSIGPYLRGELPAIAQPAAGATVTRPLGREDGRLDPALPAAELERRVRAYRPWPGTYVELAGGRLAVLRAALAPGRAGDIPGTLVAEGPGLALATGSGRLVLLEVQPAGARPMDAAAYRRGRPGSVGARVR